MRLPCLAAVLGGSFVLSASLAAQVQVADVGLTYAPWDMLPVIYGQECGPFACSPLPAGPIAAGSSGSVSVWGAPDSLFALGISTVASAPCSAVPGLGNALLLDSASVTTLAIGVVPQADPVAVPCAVQRANIRLPVPSTAPSGLRFRLQAVAFGGGTGQLAFTIAIDGSID